MQHSPPHRSQIFPAPAPSPIRWRVFLHDLIAVKHLFTRVFSCGESAAYVPCISATPRSHFSLSVISFPKQQGRIAIRPIVNSLNNSNWPKQPISRVLFPQQVTLLQAMVIHLGPPLPTASSSQPGSTNGPSLTLPYLALLLVGFTWHPASPPDPVSSYLTLSPLPAWAGGLLSVALSLGSPPLDVIQHHALWSPDFPLP